MSVKIGLGTVQFGVDYGVANISGRPNLATVSDIINVANTYKIDLLDTAVAYGDSESVLGRVGINDAKVVTKLPPIPSGTSDILGWVESEVIASLKRLGLERLHGVLIHNPAEIYGDYIQNIVRGLDHILELGLSKRVGVSIQHPDHDLPAVLRHMTPGLIQSPLNLLDDRLLQSGWLNRLKNMGCEVHTRSTFLQGLLLMSPAERPAFFSRWAPDWQIWQDWLSKTGLRPMEACLRFVLAQSEIDYCIIGVDNVSQLHALMKVGNDPLPSLPVWSTPVDLNLITPSRWNLT